MTTNLRPLTLHCPKDAKWHTFLKASLCPQRIMMWHLTQLINLLPRRKQPEPRPLWWGNARRRWLRFSTSTSAGWWWRQRRGRRGWWGSWQGGRWEPRPRSPATSDMSPGLLCHPSPASRSCPGKLPPLWHVNKLRSSVVSYYLLFRLN